MNEQIKKLLTNNPRLSDYYNVGPVQRASVEDFLECIINETLKIVEKHRITLESVKTYDVQDKYWYRGRIKQCNAISNAIEKYFEAQL